MARDTPGSDFRLTPTPIPKPPTTDGIALPAESRRGVFNADSVANATHYAVVDDQFKLFDLPDPHRYVGIGVAEETLVDAPDVVRVILEIAAGLPPHRLTVREYTDHVSQLFTRYASAGLDMTLVVAGYDPHDPEGHVFTAVTPSDVEPAEQHVSAGGITTAGACELGLVLR
jgi:hypothetical protein